MLIGFLNKIITSTAQSFLEEKQKEKIEALIAEGVFKSEMEKPECSNGTADLKTD